MIQSTVEQEKNYNILKNASGNLMILIKARLDNAESPKIIYNGGKHAVLYRNNCHAIVLDFIHPSIRNILNDTEKVLVVEEQDGSIIREYTTEVHHIAELPLPQDLVLH